MSQTGSMAQTIEKPGRLKGGSVRRRGWVTFVSAKVEERHPEGDDRLGDQ